MKELVAALLMLVATGAVADDLGRPSGHDAAAIIGETRRMLGPDAIDERMAVRIGGIDQWVSVRGVDRRNPVLIVFHGGPGYVAMPMSWWFGRGWEEYFTVVHWDQRGAGKTYLLNDPKQAGTVTLDRMLDDAEELTAWARKTLGKDKVFVLGHSWGSWLGVKLEQRRPEWLHAYVGVGQLADSPEQERRGWRFAMDAARKAGNAEAVKELEAIAPYAAPGKAIPVEDLYVQRKWVQVFGGTMLHRRDNAADSQLARLSPDYTDDEVGRIWEGNAKVTKLLLPEIVGHDLGVKRLACPLVLLEGRHDWNVTATGSAEWYERVEAPEKRYVWFERSAHIPMTEEPGRFLDALIHVVRPFAERAGDAP